MLSNPDRQLVRRDAAVPGLALVLDHDLVLDAVRRVWPEDAVATLTSSYLKYKPGALCLAGYIAHTPHGPLPLYALACSTVQYARVRACRPTAIDTSTATFAPALLDEHHVALWRFPADRKLVGLPGLAVPELRSRLLRKLLPDEPRLWSARLEILRYKPERRFVGKLVADDRAAAVVKAYDAGDFENAWRAAKTVKGIAAREPLTVSRALGRSRSQRLIVSRWLAGRPLSGLLSAAAGCAAHRIGEVGSALAELHRQGPRHLASIAPEGEAMAVLTAANAAAVLCPALAAKVRELGVRVATELLASANGQCLVHGDFSADQVLVGGDGVAIIDYDRAGLGDPGVDLGSFVAQLERDQVADRLSATRVGEIAGALIDGYCSRARCRRPLHTDLFVAAGLLRLAPHSFRMRHFDWPEQIERVVQRAERVFADHCRGRAAGS